MNLNVKVDGEEEQPLQYVNRFAFNIPSGATTFNLNIVNPGLSNQSYILNPMNSVGQSIVAYQPPMALQSYIALPTEAEGNIIHSLPVGVPVPVGLPVSTGLLQNNFVNTSIIIGNEECNAQGVIKSTASGLNPENEIKINYIEKPLKQLNHSKANGIGIQNIGVSSQQTTAEAGVKKPCPLEMSIKAANIDIEFEKCEPVIPVLPENADAVIGKQPLLAEHVPLESELKSGVIKVPFDVASAESSSTVELKEAEKKKKTEITWEDDNKQGSGDNGFQESLICEVEEANDDEDEFEGEEEEEEEMDVEEDEEEEEEGEEEEEAEEEEMEEDDEEEEEEEEEKEKEKGGEKEEEEIESETGVNNIDYKSINSSEGSSSSEESDSLPLSVAFRLDKLPNSKSNTTLRWKGKYDNSSNNNIVDVGKSRQKKCKRNKKQREELEEDVKEDETEKERDDWSESDDDVLNLKRIKNEFNYKCFYEPKTVKSATSLVLKIDNKSKKFVRVRSCCSKRECGKKITVQDQKAAHKNFYSLESNAKRDAYLMNCIEYVQRNRSTENVKDKGNNQLLSKLEEETNIQLEIENESNGNQKLSDEIQKAINESLKDCAAVNETRNEEGKCNEVQLKNKLDGIEKAEKNSWNFYVVIDRCRKKICLQFLLKLFQIPKSRIKYLQKKVLSGSPHTEDSTKTSQNVWDLAKSHLEELESAECLDCKANPRHRFLTERRTKEELFSSFRNFYFHKLGRGPNIKYASYKRFLDKKTSISFGLNQEGICSECEELKKHEKRKQNKVDKNLVKSKKGKGSKKWVIKTDSEDGSSDDEPLLKRRKLKLTIPLKPADNKIQQNTGKRSSKKYSGENKNKGKSKQSGSRGRDVWSLMLLHLETMPYKECKSCISKKRHRFLNPSLTTQELFEDYRKYFLKETNSELGLGFTMYEKYFNKNCNYMMCDVDVNSANCPGCTTTGKS